MKKYRITELKTEEDKIGIIITSDDDGFAVWVPLDEFKKMSEEDIKKLVHNKVKERIKFLKNLERKKTKEHIIDRNKEVRLKAIKIEVVEDDEQDDDTWL